MLTILQAGFHYSETEGFGYDGSYTLAIILMVAVAVVGMIVQMRLKAVTRRYSEKPSPRGMTGREIAEKMLHDNGIYNVAVTHVKGHLTDHYNPTTMTINLSDDVYNSATITAIAVAAHECGHAVQHAEGYAPIQLRSRLVPIVNLSSKLAGWVILLGIVMMSFTNSATLCWVGIALVAVSALFAVVTLPVEYNASQRAIAWLESSDVLGDDELDGAHEALRWAARTYLVAALSAIVTILYYVALIKNRR
ncbi:MAG: zinc metallopeptidase [Alistipes sp.]|nr:zinc metallopeptidase [Alistipes sp.]